MFHHTNTLKLFRWRHAHIHHERVCWISSHVGEFLTILNLLIKIKFYCNITALLISFQEKYSLKRTKPSLSIVNPLDVLRQRVMLEMARRQMENANKQVRKLSQAQLRKVSQQRTAKNFSCSLK